MKTGKLKLVLSGFLFLIIALSTTLILLETGSHYDVSKTIHRDAPVITKKSIVIHAPVEKVWKIFTDVDNWNAWQKEIVNPKMHGEFKPDLFSPGKGMV